MNETTEALNKGDAALLPSQTVLDRPAVTMTLPAAAPAGQLSMGTPGALLQIAMNQGADLDRLERLMQMQLQWEANEARKQFIAAMADFKLNPPTILKTKRVYFESNKGGATTDYFHATHADVTLPIAAGLARHGISHCWVPEQRDGHVHVTCVLTHRLGHSESVHMFAAPDNSGNKNGVQAICSTKTLLERYTLLSATGLSTADMPDDDGRGAGSANPHDAHQHHDSGRQQAANTSAGGDGKAYYADEVFTENFKSYRKTLNKGKTNADDLITFVESNGTFFTDSQKRELRNYKPVTPVPA